jgi:hypothetical protein
VISLVLAHISSFDRIVPDLKCSRAQHTRLLVLCHVWGGCTLVVGDFLVLFARDRVLRGFFGSCCRVGIAGYYDVVVVGLGIVWVFTATRLVVFVVHQIGLGLFVELDEGLVAIDVRLC